MPYNVNVLGHCLLLAIWITHSYYVNAYLHLGTEHYLQTSIVRLLYTGSLLSKSITINSHRGHGYVIKIIGFCRIWLYPCPNFRAEHDYVIKWKHFPRYWPFVRVIHRSAVNFPHKGQWREALMLSLICIRINGWVNNREAGDLRRYRAYYDVTVMS